MRIVVLDGHTLNPGDNPWDPVAALGELTIHARTQPSEIVARAQDAAIVIINKAPLSAPTLAQLPQLQFIAVTATGYNIVDVAAARQRGIPVANVPEYGTDSVAQFTIALLLELCQQVGRHNESVQAGNWSAQNDFCYWETPQIELAGKTLAIIGHGRIGKRVATIARALGMRVCIMGRDLAGLSEADVITLHCPLTAENAGLVNREFLGRLKPTAFLINTARGGLVVEQDLAAALKAGQLAGAAMDVVSEEPMRPDNPLRGAPRCLITPHMAWASLAARRRLMQTTAQNIAAFLAGKPINIVNP